MVPPSIFFSAESVSYMSTIQLIKGDCLKELHHLADASIDFVLSDPPYGHSNNDGDLIHNREKALGEDKKRMVRTKNGSLVPAGKKARQVQNADRPIANDKGEEADNLLKKVLKHCKRLLVPGGNAAVCCGGGGSHARKENPNEPSYAWWSIWIDQYLRFKQMIVWDKGPMGMGWHYRRSYEVVLVGFKPGGKYKWYDETDKVENIIRPGDYGIGKIIPNESEHPTPKPVELAMHFIRLHTQEGDTVLDPFAGAGWVGVACKLLNRNFIGIEIDPHWYGMAEKRIAKTKSLSDIIRRVPASKKTDDPHAHLGFCFS